MQWMFIICGFADTYNLYILFHLKNISCLTKLFKHWTDRIKEERVCGEFMFCQPSSLLSPFFWQVTFPSEAHTAYSGYKPKQSFTGWYVPVIPPMRMTLDFLWLSLSIHINSTLRKPKDKCQVRDILQNTWPVSTPQNC